MPTGEARCEAGVLALLTNGERELVVGDDDASVVLIGIDEYAGSPLPGKARSPRRRAGPRPTG